MTGGWGPATSCTPCAISKGRTEGATGKATAGMGSGGALARGVVGGLAARRHIDVVIDEGRSEGFGVGIISKLSYELHFPPGPCTQTRRSDGLRWQPGKDGGSTMRGEQRTTVGGGPRPSMCLSAGGGLTTRGQVVGVGAGSPGTGHPPVYCPCLCGPWGLDLPSCYAHPSGRPGPIPWTRGSGRSSFTSTPAWARDSVGPP